MIAESMSLHEMVCNSRHLAPRQKCALALILAASVLQLHDTPWLPQRWDTKDIFLLREHSGSPFPSHFYVSKTFTSSSTNRTVNRRCLIENETVLALGIALLELSYCAPLSSLANPADGVNDGREDSMTPVCTAKRLAEELKDFEFESYLKAILRCITFSFDADGSSLEVTQFARNSTRELWFHCRKTISMRQEVG